jgi:predicted nucleic acid-binding protein
VNAPPLMAAVVDTDVYSLLYVRKDSPDPRVPGWRKRLVGRRVLTTFQTRAEVLALASANAWGGRRAGELRAQLDRTATIGVDDSVIEAYATLVAECRRVGHALQQKQHTADRWIAACAIAKDVELLAGDGIFADTPGLRLVDGVVDV